MTLTENSVTAFWRRSSTAAEIFFAHTTLPAIKNKKEGSAKGMLWFEQQNHFQDYKL